MARTSKKPIRKGTAKSSTSSQNNNASAKERPLSMRAKRAWKEIEKLYRQINALIDCLQDEDRNPVFARFQDLADKIKSRWWTPHTASTLGKSFEQGALLGLDFGKKIKEEAKKMKDHYTPKPRMTERNKEIVRIHDEEDLSFGKIGRRLQQLNPKWVGGDGKPLSRDATEKAYHRTKTEAKG
jgi:hypothetical protein